MSEKPHFAYVNGIEQSKQEVLNALIKKRAMKRQAAEIQKKNFMQQLNTKTGNQPARKQSMRLIMTSRPASPEDSDLTSPNT